MSFSETGCESAANGEERRSATTCGVKALETHMHTLSSATFLQFLLFFHMEPHILKNKVSYKKKLLNVNDGVGQAVPKVLLKQVCGCFPPPDCPGFPFLPRGHPVI